MSNSEREALDARLKQWQDSRTAQPDLKRKPMSNTEREAMRAEFEAWKSEGGIYPKAVLRKDDGEYLYGATECSWIAWQAARAAQPAADINSELLELAEQLIACHDDQTCPALFWGRELIARAKEGKS